MFHVLLLNARLKNREDILFEGDARSVFLPGEEGEFEVLDFHKPLISRLKKGVIVVDNEKEFPVEGGVVKMRYQSMVAMVDV